MTDLEALRVEIDELRKDLADEIGHRERVERSLKEYLDESATSPFYAREYALSLLRGQ